MSLLQQCYPLTCYTVIKLCKLRFKVINVYIAPDKEIEETDFSSLFGPHTLIIGDFNAKSKLWGSPQADKRGLLLEEMVDRHSAIVLNTGQATYQHYTGAESHLDVAIVDSASAALSDWSVLNNTMGSDHFLRWLIFMTENRMSS